MIDTDIELNYIDSLSGNQFETYMTNLLSEVGYQHMVHTPFINDHGLDAYGYNKNGLKVGFQFKKYNYKVPYKAIYETLGGATFYRTSLNYIITNSYYTNNTYKICRQMNYNDSEHIIKLINRNGLRFLINKRYQFNNYSNYRSSGSSLNMLAEKLEAGHPLTAPTSNNSAYENLIKKTPNPMISNRVTENSNIENNDNEGCITYLCIALVILLIIYLLF